MSLSSSLPRLTTLEFSTLYHNAAHWPLPRKILLGVALACLLLMLGDSLYLSALREQLHRQEAREVTLQQQFANKVGPAANLEAYARQLEVMRGAFAEQLHRLPTATEVPGLLEDITRLGLAGGLVLEEIRLLDEQVQPLYIELPMQISLIGAYHDLATFVSSVSGLSRIVTLHDFVIRPADLQEGSPLRLNLLAKTYRYNDQGALP